MRRLGLFAGITLMILCGGLFSFGDHLKPSEGTLYQLMVEKHGLPLPEKRPQWLEDYLYESFVKGSYAGGLIPGPMYPKANSSWAMRILGDASLSPERLMEDAEFRQATREAIDYMHLDVLYLLGMQIDTLHYMEQAYRDECDRYAELVFSLFEGLLVLASADGRLPTTATDTASTTGRSGGLVPGSDLQRNSPASGQEDGHQALSKTWGEKYSPSGSEVLPHSMESFLLEHLPEICGQPNAEVYERNACSGAEAILRVLGDPDCLERVGGDSADLLLLRQSMAYLRPELLYRLCAMADARPSSREKREHLLDALEGLLYISSVGDAESKERMVDANGTYENTTG